MLCACPDAPAQPGKGAWNKDLSNLMDNIEKEIKTDKPESESPPAPVPESIEPEPNETEPEPDEPGSADIPDNLKEETEPPEPKSPGADGYLALVDENGLARWPQDRMPVKIYID
ncbi:MAG: hypothetical protein AB7W16_21995, partial [Candidatus Obscuribacterales bacterium]